MTKKKNIETMADAQMHPSSENASVLLYKLITFYNENPNYETSVVDICTLMRLAHQEMNKFIHRPHTRVTKVYFDSDVPNSEIV